MSRLLRLEEASPFAWAQLEPCLSQQVMDNARGALAGQTLILGMNAPTIQRYSQTTEDVHAVTAVLVESEFLGGIATGLVAQGRSNNWLARELAGSRPSEAYRLGVFAGATALGGYLDGQMEELDSAVREDIRQAALGLRDQEDVKGFRKADGATLLEMARRARQESEFRSLLTGTAIDEFMKQEAAHGDAGERFRGFLASENEAKGKREGVGASRSLFNRLSLAEGDTLASRLEGAPAFVRRIVDALPPRIYDISIREQYNRGVRRALAFMAMATAGPNQRQA